MSLSSRYSAMNHKIIAEYPDPKEEKLSTIQYQVLAAALHMGYESIRMQEYIVLFNPLARRVFIFSEFSNQIKEVDLKLPKRTYEDLVWKLSTPPPTVKDVCWQILPNGHTGIWVVVPAHAKRPGALGTPLEPNDDKVYFAIPVDLYDGHAGDSILIQSNLFPFFIDVENKIISIEDAIKSYKK